MYQTCRNLAFAGELNKRPFCVFVQRVFFIGMASIIQAKQLNKNSRRPCSHLYLSGDFGGIYELEDIFISLGAHKFGAFHATLLHVNTPQENGADDTPTE
jgi:hypothetical protein